MRTPRVLKMSFPSTHVKNPGDEEFLSQDGIVKSSVADDPEAMKLISRSTSTKDGWNTRPGRDSRKSTVTTIPSQNFAASRKSRTARRKNVSSWT